MMGRKFVLPNFANLLKMFIFLKRFHHGDKVMIEENFV